MNKTAAISQFLSTNAHPDLAHLYSPELEVQVNVAPDGGTRVEKEYQGKKWHGWTDGKSTWKMIRIPWSADKNPKFTDTKMAWDMKHAEKIGLTGWNWVDKCSLWVGFDVDSIVGHKEGLPDEEIAEVLAKLMEIPWVTLRRSRGGKGFHVYVFLDPAPETKTHTEHAAVARAVLSLMAREIGEDLSAKVDVFGNILWIWHRDTADDGFELLQQGGPLTEVPSNWREYLKTQSSGTGDDLFDSLTRERRRVELDTHHKRVLDWMKEHGGEQFWDNDKNMFVCHTFALKKCHRKLKLVGIFETASEGKHWPADQNCFMFPLPDGAWDVYRHGLNTNEHPTWSRTPQGWTRCFFNRAPELQTSAVAHGGIETPAGDYSFLTLNDALAALGAMDAPEFDVDDRLRERATLLSRDKKIPGRMILTVEGEKGEDRPAMWADGPGNKWQRVVQVAVARKESPRMDHILRHVVSGGEDAGFFLNPSENGAWIREPKANVVAVLRADGHKASDAEEIIGNAVRDPWSLVSLPFQSEHPGGRRWNRRAAQRAFEPEEGPCPTWDEMLHHLGQSLDHVIADDEWCRENGLIYGADYLRCWVASVFQEPNSPLPYLFFYGPEASGKTTFHQAVGMLMLHEQGYARADQALKSRGGFNGELDGAVICVVEESDLSRDQTAYERLRDWVTAPRISIHPKNGTPYMATNTSHWIQCANSLDRCPVMPGDTRVGVMYVPKPAVLVQREKLFEHLREEAPAFMHQVLDLEIPPASDRLRLPVLSTGEKETIEEVRLDFLQKFIREECHDTAGGSVPFTEFYQKLMETIPFEQRHFWTKNRVSREIPHDYPCGKMGRSGSRHIGNLTFEKGEPKDSRLHRKKGRLVPVTKRVPYKKGGGPKAAP